MITPSTTLQTVLVKKLSSWGLQSTCFFSGEDARNFENQEEPCIVLFDLNASGSELLCEFAAKNKVIVIGYSPPPLSKTHFVFLKRPVFETTLRHSLQKLLKQDCGVKNVPKQPQTYSCVPKILLVEDNAINQTVIKKILRSAGFNDVKIAENGKCAIDAIKSELFDVILMDIMVMYLQK